MAELRHEIDPAKCKCGGEPCVVVREYCAQVYCTECGREVKRTTRERVVRAWNDWMKRTQEAKRRRKGHGARQVL